MIGLDTNVRARYLLVDDEAQSTTAATLIESLSPLQPGFVTHVVLVELHWLLRRVYRVPREACLNALNRLVEMRALEFEDGESVVRALALAEDGADFPDALVKASLELFGIREAVTFDREAAKRLGWRLLEPAGA
jgi:predicted nucleic-acid-binding protein